MVVFDDDGNDNRGHLLDDYDNLGLKDEDDEGFILSRRNLDNGVLRKSIASIA